MAPRSTLRRFAVPLASATLLALPLSLFAAPDGTSARNPGRRALHHPDPGTALAAATPGAQSKRRTRSSKKKKRGPAYSAERLAQLVEWNSKALFGGRAKVSGDRLTVTFDDKGQITRGFVGVGVLDADSDELQGANRKFILHGDQKGGEKLYPKLAAIGIGKGRWLSRFRFAGDTRLEFGFRLPNLIGGKSTFSAIINWDPKRKSGYETRFFHSISRLSGGRRRATQLTRIKKARRHAKDWFPRKGESTRVQFGMADGRCKVHLLGKDYVQVPVKRDDGGHVSFVFSDIVFTLDDIVISGKLDRQWCEEELESLAEAGELVTEDPAKVDAPGEPGAGSDHGDDGAGEHGDDDDDNDDDSEEDDDL